MIETNTYYSASKLFRMNIFPWITSYRTLVRWICADTTSGDKSLFKAIKKGVGNGTRYYVKGEHILKLLEELKNGKTL